MTQQRIFDYRDPRSTQLLNHKLRDLIPWGIHEGFHLAADGTLGPGVLQTREGVRISEDQPRQVVIPPNTAVHPRTDLIACLHEFVASPDPSEARFEAIPGTPAPGSMWDSLPAVPNDATPIAFARLNPGATSYGEVFQLGLLPKGANVRLQGAIPDIRIVKGTLGAFFWYPDVNNGTVSLYIVPPGTLNDGDPIDFTSPAVTIDAQGIEQLRELAGVGRTTETVYGNAQSLIAEAQTRLNTGNALDARITNEAGASGAALAALQSAIDTEGVERINADVNTREQLRILQGTPNWNDLPADNIASIDARLSMLAGGGGSGLPLHRTKHEAGGIDEVRFDDLADGSAFKKMTAAERGDIATAFAHATDASIHLSAAEKTDLTDGGDATVHHHDGRYYQKGYVDGALNTKSDVGHHHDTRYLRRVWSGSNLVENGQTVVFVTLDLAPDHIAISANDPGTLGEPTNPTYCMGPRITSLHVEIEKVSGSPDKDYVVRVNNGYGFDLWVNLDVFSID